MAMFLTEGSLQKMECNSDKNLSIFSFTVTDSDDESNMEMQIQVKSLSLILNKPEYELAKAQVSDITAHLLHMDGKNECCYCI